MALTAPQTKRLIALHGWLAVCLSVLLYAVVLTGTVVVFSEEIGHWAEGRTNQAAPLSKPLNAHFQRLSAQVPDALKRDVIIGEGPGGSLRFFFGSSQVRIKDGSGPFGRQFLINPDTGAILSARAGFLEDIGQGHAAETLGDFLVDLHVRLHVSGRWGLYLTGILGIAMLVATMTGVLIRRNILKELFVTERPGGRVVSSRDRHNLAGVWSLPFAVLLSFTGAFLSFATSLGLPVVAMVAFGGDQGAALKAVTGAPIAADATPAPVADLDAVTAEALRIAGAPIRVINIHRAGRADAVIETFHGQADGALRRTSLEFAGPTGAFLGEARAVGTKPSAGSLIAELMGPLHFGDFAGKLSRVVWAALGAAMSFAIVSGLKLWLHRRRDAAAWAAGERALACVAWGLPLAMTGAAYGYFLTRLAGDPVIWTARGFVCAAAAAIALALIRHTHPAARLSRTYAQVLGLGLVALPVLRLQTGGLSWGEALLNQGLDVLFVDLLCLVGGGVLLYGRRNRGTGDIHDAAAPASLR